MSDLLRRASWLSRASSSRRDRFSDASHELPRWRSPSPLAASMIPPPIVQSTYTSPPPAAAIAKSTFFEQPIASDTREDDLHADLQYLLDAQAEALARGVDGGSSADHASGSTTPTARSVGDPLSRTSSRPTRRNKKPGLRSARKGLYTTIRALSEIKDEELHDIDVKVEDTESKLQQIERWDTKRKGLEGASSEVDASEDTVRVQRLRQEAKTLQDSINEVELQLADMKGRHRKLTRQIAAAENSVQAKLASYTQSISLLEADVQKFLSIQPAPPAARDESGSGHLSVWQLPPKRRTLEMAKEFFEQERDAMLERRRGTQEEKEALEDGGQMWKDVAVTVTEFEKKVRAEMSGASMANSGHAWDDTPPATSAESLKELLTQMDLVIEDLDTKYRKAEESNWKLLIAAIGAELDALRQGKQILNAVLGEPAPEQDCTATADAEVDSSGDEIRDLDKSFETAKRMRASNGDTDDEPDPELLFSSQDNDTD
ncbi:hypothetical protein Q7P37_006782 [Cladosporium fusiforme]